MRLFVIALILPVVACTQFPELDDAVSSNTQDAAYPTLLPVQGLLAQTATQGPTPEQTIGTLNARVAALRNRASRLRGTVVDTRTRQRMQNGVN